jgi:hypothetical protein
MLFTLQDFKNLFGRNFVLGVFSPILVVVTLSFGLYFGIFGEGLGATLTNWEKLPLQIQLFITIMGLLAITVLASLIYSYQYSITRLFRGYWPRVRGVEWFRKRRIEIYRQRWIYLDSQASNTSSETEKIGILRDLQIYYPPENNLDNLMPTRLGNILRASEAYPYDRYGIDTVIIWDRLRPLLPKETLATLESTQISIDFMLLMAILATTFSLIWCPLVAFFTNRWLLFLFCSLGFPLACICYQNAMQRALVYSEQFKVIFDLHRHDLLKALNLSSQTEQERAIWEYIGQFFQYSAPIPLKVAPKDKSQGWDQVAEALTEYIKRMNYPKP